MAAATPDPGRPGNWNVEPPLVRPGLIAKNSAHLLREGRIQMSHKRTIACVIAVGSAIASTQSALAVYTGLTIENHATVSIGSESYNVWRLYANFSDPGDRLVVGFGSPTYGTMTVQSRNFNDSDFGSPFFNIPGGTTAPSQATIDANPDAEWDTFVTIGTPIAELPFDGDHTSLTPGFTPITGTNWSINNAGWYLTPTYDHDSNAGTPPIPPEQSVASWAGDGDLANRVLMMQVTVKADENVRGTLNLSWFPPIGQGEIVTNQAVQTFNSFIPGPSALGLLGVVALAGRWRRRA
jgi:hypothetical protein